MHDVTLFLFSSLKNFFLVGHGVGQCAGRFFKEQTWMMVHYIEIKPALILLL